MPLDTYEFIPCIVAKPYILLGLSVPLQLILVQCSGIVYREPEDVRPEMEERLQKELFQKLFFCMLCTEKIFTSDGTPPIKRLRYRINFSKDE